jgi:ABC-type nickel/cobalt efflux system permease component RcnA
MQELNEDLIVQINMLLVVAIYIFAGVISIDDGAIIGFLISLLQFAINLVLAVIFLIIYALQPKGEEKIRHPLFLSGTFFLSAIIVVILSMPVCLVWGTITF